MNHAKNLYRSLFILLISLSFVLSACDDEIVNTIKKDIEEGSIHYGISRMEFEQSKAFGNIIMSHSTLKNNSANRNDGTANQLTAQELIERLDLSKGYLHLHDDGKELLSIPVRTQGDYKRVLLSLTRDEVTNSFLLTYPDSTNNKLFYISTLDGILLQKVTIQDDGVGITETFNFIDNNAGTISRSNNTDCTETETVYEACSPSGVHSFALGNAMLCTYWNNLNDGTPPTVATIEVPCDDSGSGSGDSDSSSGDQTGGTSVGGINDDDGFESVPPKKGDDSLVSEDECVANLDCDECNLDPHDINNDCDITEVEININQINNCLGGTLTGEQKNFLLNNPQIANSAYAAIGIICNPDSVDFFNLIIDDLKDGDELDFEELEEMYNDMDKECQATIFTSHIVNSDKLLSEFLKTNFLGNDTYNIQFSDIEINSEEDPIANTQLPNDLVFSEDTAIIIEFDNTYLDNATDLSIIQTTAHELVHAYLIFLYIENELLSFNPNYTDLNIAFENYESNPNNENGNALGAAMHDVFDDFLNIIVDSVFEYASTNNIPDVTLDYCQKLVIGSHQYTQSFQQLTDEEQLEYSTIATNEQEGHTNAKGAKCN